MHILSQQGRAVSPCPVWKNASTSMARLIFQSIRCAMLQLADGRIGTGHDDVLGALVPSACVLVNAALLHVLTSRQAWTVLGAPDEGHQCATSSSRAASMPYRAAHTPLPARSLVSSIPETATDAWLANKLLLQVEPSCGLHAAHAATPIPTRWSSHASTNSRLCSCMLLCCCQTALFKPWGLGTHHMHYSCRGGWCGNLDAPGMQAKHACVSTRPLSPTLLPSLLLWHQGHCARLGGA